MDTLHDSFFQFIVNNGISASLGAIGIIIAVLSYLKARNRKELIWQKIHVEALKQLKNSYQISLRIWNSGDVPILESDYAGPIKFLFGKEAKVLNIEILKTNPSSVKIRLQKAFKRNLKSVILGPLLLNSKDSIEFKVGLSGYSPTSDTISIENTGIVGVREIIERRPLTEASKKKLLFISILFILGGQGLGYTVQSLLYPLVNNQTSPFILLFLAHFLVLYLKSFAPAVCLSHSRPSLNKIMSFHSLILLWIMFSLLCTLLSLLPIIPTLILRIF